MKIIFFLKISFTLFVVQSTFASLSDSVYFHATKDIVTDGISAFSLLDEDGLLRPLIPSLFESGSTFQEPCQATPVSQHLITSLSESSGAPLRSACQATVIDKSHILTLAACVVDYHDTPIKTVRVKFPTGEFVKAICHVPTDFTWRCAGINDPRCFSDLAICQMEMDFPISTNFTIHTSSNGTSPPSQIVATAAWGATIDRTTNQPVICPITTQFKSPSAPLGGDATKWWFTNQLNATSRASLLGSPLIGKDPSSGQPLIFGIVARENRTAGANYAIDFSNPRHCEFLKKFSISLSGTCNK